MNLGILPLQINLINKQTRRQINCRDVESKLREFYNIAEGLSANLLEWGSETQFWKTTAFKYSMKDLYELAGHNFGDMGSQNDHMADHTDMVERIIEHRD